MIKVIGGTLYQWDTGRYVHITVKNTETITEVHCYSRGDKEALVVEIQLKDDSVIAPIPNILMQSSRDLIVCVMRETDNGEQTEEKANFHIIERPKPSDYVYTETEVKRWEDLEKRVNDTLANWETNAIDRLSEAALKAATEAFNDELTALKQADEDNATELGNLRAEYEKALEKLQEADERNATAIKELTEAYNAKVKELETADAENKKAIEDHIKAYNEKVIELNGNAHNASLAASNAQTSAVAAQTAANNAQNSANEAQETANNAVEAANAAQDTANNALDIVNEAQNIINKQKVAYDAKVAELEAADKANSDALETHKTTYNEKVSEIDARLDEEIARAQAAEKANSDAIELLTNGISVEEIDSVKDLINYTNEHGAEVTQMKRDIASNSDAIEATNKFLANHIKSCDAKTTELQKADADNAMATEELTEAYNAKVAELEEADESNAKTLQELRIEYEEALAELQEADESNATAVEQVDKELKQLIKGLYEILPPTLINELSYVPLALIEGYTYIVVCDGVEYTCVSKTLTHNEQSIVYLGNLYKLKEMLPEDEELPFEIEDTGEPFLISGMQTLLDKNKRATLSVYAYLHNVGEILPETSIDKRIVNFTSPTLLKEGDVVYATIDGEPRMVQMEVQDINNGGDDGWTEEDGLCIPDGTYLVADFDFPDFKYKRLVVNGTNCYFQNDYYLDDLKPRTVEIFKCEKGDGTIPEKYLPKPDDALDPASERPVQNKVVAKAIDETITKQNVSVDAVGGLIPRRDENGNINAPNQITHAPSDDQYISRRYFEKVADERYLKIEENTWGMKAVYAQHPKSGANKPTKIGATEEAIGGALVVRTVNGNITAPDQTDYDFAPKPREFISREYLESVVPYSESIILPAGTSISMPLRKVCGIITLVGNGETVVEITQVVETSGLVTKTVKASKLHQLNITRDPHRKEYSFWISSVRDGTLGIPNVEYMIKNVNEDSLLTIGVTTASNMTLLYQPVRANLSSTSYIYSIEV